MNVKTWSEGAEQFGALNLIAFWKHHPVADQAAHSLSHDIEAFYRQVPSDIIKLTPAGNYQVAERGGIAHWQNDVLGRRTFNARFVKGEQELKALAALPEVLSLIEEQIIEAGRLLVKNHTRPTYATIFTPLTQLFMLAGEEQLVNGIYSMPRLILAVLDKLTQLTQLLVSRYLQAGVQHFYLAMQHRSEAILPVEFYRLLGDSSDEKLIAFIRTHLTDESAYPSVILHVHGRQVYFDGLPDTTDVAVHYELTEDNLPLETFCQQRNNELVIGLPLAFWEDCSVMQLRDKIKQVQYVTQQRRTLFTAPCVVPLAVPAKSISRWVDKFKSAVSLLNA